MARRKEAPDRAGTGSRQCAARQAAGCSGGLRRCALPHDRRIRCRQDRIFSVSQHRIRLRLRHELPDFGYQGRPRAQLRKNCAEVLRLSRISGRPAQPDPLGWK